MTRKRSIIMILAMVMLILVGLLAVAYPQFAARHSDQAQSEVIVGYEQEVEEKDREELDAARSAAQAWNAGLFSGRIDIQDTATNGYFDLLDLKGNGCMGYVEIPKIDVTLPIYHDTGEDALTNGAGHIPQTSLPVGGENTHAAISAHTGVASNPLFTDLEQMELGDVFYLHVLGEKLAYQVESIEVVEPAETSSLQIQRGRDLVTLITCTPYGINTHRLLVRGYRIEIPDAVEDETVFAADVNEANTESLWMWQYTKSILIGLALSGILIAAVVAVVIIRKRSGNQSRS